MTYRSAHGVPVVLEVLHLRPPVLDRVGLRILLASAVAESTLGEDVGDDVHLPEVDLDPLDLDRLLGDRAGRAPRAAARVKVQPEKKE